MKFHNFQIIIEQEEDLKEGYFAYCPQLPGCYSNGATLEEARNNMREAIELHLAALGKEWLKPPEFAPTRPIYKEELVIGLPS
jgi:predicted RNase H-like HicB family nuclease